MTKTPTESYRIIKIPQEHGLAGAKTVKRGLTLDQARNICADEESSSRTAKNACNGSGLAIKNWWDAGNHWFYGFTRE